jgi:hypothetical protein
MEIYNLRLVAKPETYNDITRYALIDHYGTRWVNHQQENVYLRGQFYDPENGDNLDPWRLATSETVEEAFRNHAPLSECYGIIPPNTDLVKITIELLSAPQRGALTFYAIAQASNRFNIRPEPGEYYAFRTIDNVQEMFLYSDIKHVSFQEF